MNLQSDTTWVLLQPSNLILIGIILGSLAVIFDAPKLGQRILLISLIFLAIPAILPISELVARPLENRLSAPNPMPNQVEGILVLGGSVNWNVSQTRGQLSLNESAERMIAAAALAERYPNAKLVLTGLSANTTPNDFKPQTNAQSFFFGPEYSGREVIYLDAARSTYEEALLSIQALQPRAGERWLLVTSAYHMPRAYLTFQAQGWTVIPYPVDYRQAGPLSINPTFRIMGRLNELDDFAREWGALIVYNRSGRTQSLLP